MSLERVRKVYERLGSEDPLWAVLTNDAKRAGKWETDEFFETGRTEIDGVLSELNELALPAERRRALDFGCGVGRLSRALCEHFDAVTGVDISSSMIQSAERYNRHLDRCRFLVNTEEHLRCFEDSSFDLVYSSITLQHMPAEYALGYVREFLRLLDPDGIAVFQMRVSRRTSAPSWFEGARRFWNESVRPLWKIVRGRPPVQVHLVREERILEAIHSSGGESLRCSSVDRRPRKSRESLRYFVRRGRS
jgi:SAM-dependent methyltransferase